MASYCLGGLIGIFDDLPIIVACIGITTGWWGLPLKIFNGDKKNHYGELLQKLTKGMKAV